MGDFVDDSYYDYIDKCKSYKYYLKKINTVKLFTSFSNEEKLVCEEKIKYYFDNRTPRLAHMAFSVLELNREKFAESYTVFLKLLSEVSNGRFIPENILEEKCLENNNMQKISFDYRGKKYKIDIQGESVNDVNIFHIVNKALDDSIPPMRYFGFMDMGYAYSSKITPVAFVNEKVYYHAKHIGVVPDTDEVDDPFFVKKVKPKKK